MGTLAQLLTLSFGMGLLANLHCIGMCGPIALALPLDRSNKFTMFKGVASYTLGRSIGYALLGLIIGFIGFSAKLAGSLQVLSIISGVLILLFAWKGYYNKAPQLTFLNTWISKQMGVIFKNKSAKGRSLRLTNFGFINAFLPCGMVYTALLSAMNMGSIQNASLFMLFFGLGTLPGFLGLAFLKEQFLRIRFAKNKVVVASFVSLIGIAIIVRGLNLDIPMLSPKNGVVQYVEDGELKEENVMSCCKEKETCSASKKE